MQLTLLGRTGLSISRIAFGAGPVSGLMTGENRQLQVDTLSAALDCGINWIDTAAGYGNGASERHLGEALSELATPVAGRVHIATKVRIDLQSIEAIADQVARGVEASLVRLQRPRVTLLQLHNGLTDFRGAEPASLSVSDVLGPGGALDAMRRVREQGLADFIGLTGTGQPDAMRQVVMSGQFDTLQVPYNLLNPSAGQIVCTGEVDRDYGNILSACAQQQMGVFAIRVFAAGALLGAPPSPHTLKTPYFPLALYESDSAAAARLGASSTEPMAQRAVRFVLSHPAVHSAVIGFGSPEHVRELASFFP